MKYLLLTVFLLQDSDGSIPFRFTGPSLSSSQLQPIISIVSCNNSENALPLPQYQISQAAPGNNAQSNYFIPTILNYDRLVHNGNYAGEDENNMDIGNRIQIPFSNIGKIRLPSRLTIPNRQPQNNFILQDQVENTLEIETRVKFYLFTRKNSVASQELKIHHSSTLNESHFSPKMETKLIFHGFTDVDAPGEWINLMKETYLAVSDVNLIVADFSSFPLQNLFPSSIPVFAAKRLAEFLTFLSTESGAPLNSIHIIARSYGCQIVGMSGRQLDGKLGRITALEPSTKIAIVGNHSEFKLGRDDALFVDVIHVNGKRFFFHGHQFGLVAPFGHMDVYPNIAERGLGCPGENLNFRRYSLRFCQLGRGVRYFTQSIKYPDMYPMCQCASFENYKLGQCSCHNRETMRFLGEISNTTRGVFQLFAVPQQNFPHYTNNLFGR